MLRVLILFVACLFASVASACDYGQAFRLNVDDGCHAQAFSDYGAVQLNVGYGHRQAFVVREFRDHDRQQIVVRRGFRRQAVVVEGDGRRQVVIRRRGLFGRRQEIIVR